MRAVLRNLYNWFVSNLWPENVEHSNVDNFSLKVIEKPNAQLFESMQRELLSKGKTFSIRVKGYSMRPFLEDRRDMVTIKAVDSVKVGDVVLAQIAPLRYVLHRVIVKDGNNLVLMGDGNLYGKEYCRTQDVLGKAIEFKYGKVCKVTLDSGEVRYRLDFSDSRTLFCDEDKKYIRRYTMWVRMVRWRRWFLAVYQRLPSIKLTVKYMDEIDKQNKNI